MQCPLDRQTTMAITEHQLPNDSKPGQAISCSFARSTAHQLPHNFNLQLALPELQHPAARLQQLARGAAAAARCLLAQRQHPAALLLPVWRQLPPPAVAQQLAGPPHLPLHLHMAKHDAMVSQQRFAQLDMSKT